MAGLPVCGDCIEDMICLINDFQVECGNGYVKYGDKYRCRDCGNTIITGFGNPCRGLNTEEGNHVKIRNHKDHTRDCL